jgi:hypothetical protein
MSAPARAIAFAALAALLLMVSACDRSESERLPASGADGHPSPTTASGAAPSAGDPAPTYASGQSTPTATPTLEPIPAATGTASPRLLSSGPVIITELDDGATIELALNGVAFLRLSTANYLWDDPDVQGAAVELVPVAYEQDPGYAEWEVYPLSPGAATIRATAQHNPPTPARTPAVTFIVTIEVVP